MVDWAQALKYWQAFLSYIHTYITVKITMSHSYASGNVFFLHSYYSDFQRGWERGYMKIKYLRTYSYVPSGL